MRINDQIAYTPVFLVGLKAIASHFKVGQGTVYQWMEQGAPIVRENEGGKTRYTAEAVALYFWRLQLSCR